MLNGIEYVTVVFISSIHYKMNVSKKTTYNRIGPIVMLIHSHD